MNRKIKDTPGVWAGGKIQEANGIKLMFKKKNIQIVSLSAIQYSEIFYEER